MSEFAASSLSLYLNSYTYIVEDWSLQEWTYYSNASTLSSCTFGIVAGVLHRTTHCYKFLQVAGLCIKVIGYSVMISPHGRTATTSPALLILSAILVGAGGSFSVYGSTVSYAASTAQNDLLTMDQVAAQAAVPHHDMALATALLSFWSLIGGSISSSTAATLWAQWMPTNLRRYLPASVKDAQVEELYANIALIRAYDYSDPVRQGAVAAHQHTLWGLCITALVSSLVSSGASYFQPNILLIRDQSTGSGGMSKFVSTEYHK